MALFCREIHFCENVWFILAVVFAVSLTNGQTNRDSEEPRVLILGAGMAGISAAQKLSEAGMDNFLILEGSSSIGGRVKHTQLGNHTVELGAMWIYGKGTNPIYHLARKNGVSFRESYIRDLTVRDSKGDDRTADAEDMFQRLDRAILSMDYESTIALMSNTLEDYTVISALRNYNWLPRNDLEDAVEAFSIDFEAAVSPSVLSGKHLHNFAFKEAFGDDENLPVNDVNGFSSLLVNMKRTFMPDNDKRILFNKRVKDIQNHQGTVKVLTQDGEQYEADHVIVTFSIGVLQQREVTFTPPLPKWKMMAIDKFGMAPLMHIYLLFPYTFWDSTLFILYASNQRGRHSCWQNLNVIYPGSNILQLSVFGDEAKRVEKLSDSQIIEELALTLRSMYSNRTIPELLDHRISRWLSDPLFRGAYSYWPPTFTLENMQQLAASVDNVHFAGEYISDVQYSYLHNALMAGQKTAESIVDRIRKGNASDTQSNELPFNQMPKSIGTFASLLKKSLAQVHLLQDAALLSNIPSVIIVILFAAIGYT